MTGHGFISRMLGMKTGIDGKLKGSDFYISTIGSYATMGIEVLENHDGEGWEFGLSGTSRRKGFKLTWILFPS